MLSLFLLICLLLSTRYPYLNIIMARTLQEKKRKLDSHFDPCGISPKEKKLHCKSTNCPCSGLVKHKKYILNFVNIYSDSLVSYISGFFISEKKNDISALKFTGQTTNQVLRMTTRQSFKKKHSIIPTQQHQHKCLLFF